MNRRLLIILTLCTGLFFAGCQTETVPPINEVSYAGRLSEEPVLVQSISLVGISEAEIGDAIKQAASNRGWEVEDRGPEGIVTFLTHREHESQLIFEYGDGWVKIYSVSYKIDKTTQKREERDEPAGWIRNLHKDILELLGRLPTE